MSLTGKQIRELNNAYQSVYKKPEESEDLVVLTQEDFESLCVEILSEVFESNNVELLNSQLVERAPFDPKTAVKQPIKLGIKQIIKNANRLLLKPALKKIFVPKTIPGVATRLAGYEAIKSEPVRKKAVEYGKTGGAMFKNLGQYAQDANTAVNTDKEMAGSVLADKKTGNVTTAKIERDKINLKKENTQFSPIKIYISEESKNDEDLIKKLNNKKDEKEKVNDNANVNLQNNQKNDEIKKDEVKKDEVKKDEIKKDEVKKDEIKKDEIKKNEVKKDRLPEFGKPKEVTMKDFQPPKPVDTTPKNPSGKVIPKPTKPLMKNSPAAKAGIPIETRQKFANQNAAFQATKDKNSGYTKMDFIKDFPNSQTAKKYNKGERIPGFKYKKESYEPYHIVLGYLLSEGHADTINEAHYVMTQMDDQTVQEIVALDEGPVATAGAIAGALTLGGMGLNAIKKQLDNKKKMDKGGTFKQGSMMDNIQKKKNMLKNLENY